MSDGLASAPIDTSIPSRYNHPGAPDGKPVWRGEADADAIIKAIERPRRLTDDAAYHRGRLPHLDLPSFGEADPECGEPLPTSMHFCPRCYNVVELHHVCWRYDCPQHWSYAVRRHAAGSADGAGKAPWLDALRRYLNKYYSHPDLDVNDNCYYHHLVISPERDLQLAAADELKHVVDTVIRPIMDELGIQGVVIYHPWSGDHETVVGEDVDDYATDLGEWGPRLGSDREWHDDVKQELKHRPHFHIIGVAPHVDVSVTEQVEDETGWVIHRIADENGISIADDEHMAAALTYALSHAGIYETESGQRRLAAWMKGPDVDKVTPNAKNKLRMKTIVRKEAQRTLGLPARELVCEEEYPEEIAVDRHDTDLPAFERASDQREYDPFGVGPEPGSITGLSIEASTGPTGNPGPSSPTHVDGVAGLASPPSDLPPRDVDLDAPAEDAWNGSSTTSTGTTATSSDATSDALRACDAPLLHISRAGDYLLDGERRERTPHADDLEAAYTSYIQYMTAQHLDPVEDRPKISEEQLDRDRPPDD